MMVHPRRSTMPFCVLVSFLVLLAAPTSSFHVAASSSHGQPRRTPNLRWKQRGELDAVELLLLLEDPVDKWGDAAQKWSGRCSEVVLRHCRCLRPVHRGAAGIPTVQFFIPSAHSCCSGVRALLQTPVTVNSSNGTGPPTSYTTSVAPSGAVIININNNNVSSSG